MASHLFHCVRKEFISPLTRQNVRFSSDVPNVNKTNGAKWTVLKVVGGLVPVVFVSRILGRRLNSKKQEDKTDDKNEVKEQPTDFFAETRMASRLFQCVRKGLISPLTRQNVRFSSDVPNLDKTNGAQWTVLKVVGGFVPGVLVGHILSQRLNSKSQKEKTDDKNEVKEQQVIDV
ncbi:hypothetical protein AVEN_65007-1 [Araneus ventricosus]|uniref:Uncharacterized protein n=1 Tax=Araneus ventricosus TaxID=182803 RepID=A0A4Y2M4X9_ARAVE|nr:hypothetical protein AVEN_65007-1 [Araneus ventricosus]